VQAVSEQARIQWELAVFFLRLGFTAFGGPAAHLAMMRLEAVERRQWLTSQAFLDLMGAVNLIPGPSSTQMAMMIGLRLAGWRGLVLGGVCFILPAALITLGLAWAYVRFGNLPKAQGLLYGIKPVILAVVFQALWGLARGACKNLPLLVLGMAALAAGGLGLHPLYVLLGSGLLCLGAVWINEGHPKGSTPVPAGWLTLSAASLAAGQVSLSGLFLFFLKIGSILFGSGYVLLAFLKADLVDRWHWLTQSQLLDAVAVGQMTPGPVFTTATFIGYVLGGLPGAGLATLGIFLPSFFFVAGLGLIVPKLRGLRPAAAFLDGVNVAALALMAVVTWQLCAAALVDGWAWGLGLASGLLLIRFRVNPSWLVLGGGLAGLAVQALRA